MVAIPMCLVLVLGSKKFQLSPHLGLFMSCNESAALDAQGVLPHLVCLEGLPKVVLHFGPSNLAHVKFYRGSSSVCC